MKKSKQSTKKHKKTNLWNKFRAMKWYVKIPLVLIVIIVLFLLAKLCVTAYYRHQFDSAEAKMMKLDLPKATSTTYNHSCSYKSTLKLSKGFPNCNVQRVEVFSDVSPEQNVEIVNKYISGVHFSGSRTTTNFNNDSELNRLLNEVRSSHPNISIENFSPSLRCYIFIDYPKTSDSYLELTGKEVKNNRILTVATNCYKRTLVQLYPER